MKKEFINYMEGVVDGKNIIYLMDDICIDIDREIDFQFITFILEKKLFKFDY